MFIRNNLHLLLLLFIVNTLRVCHCKRNFFEIITMEPRPTKYWQKNFTALFIETRLVPLLIDKPPQHLCHMYYDIPNWEEPHKVLTGERLRHWETKEAPKLEWPTRENTLYTMYMVGLTPWNKQDYYQGDFVEEKFNPDHPTKEPPKIQQWEQWIKINIPANNISAGDQISPYLPPRVGDPNVTEYYVVLIFEQPEKQVMASDEWKNQLGYNFNMYQTVRLWMTKYRLQDPWAGNFFHSFKKF